MNADFLYGRMCGAAFLVIPSEARNLLFHGTSRFLGPPKSVGPRNDTGGWLSIRENQSVESV